MIQVKKHENESSDKLLKRLSNHVKHTKLLQQWRKRRYFTQEPRKNVARAAAVVREAHRKENLKKQYQSL
ncbi:30S ribosomal protein S21 [Candidatus Peribacteria bacterium]|nr:30S ribosomal protein S21 [Candidatus Peribacteria bacterium]